MARHNQTFLGFKALLIAEPTVRASLSPFPATCLNVLDIQARLATFEQHYFDGCCGVVFCTVIRISNFVPQCPSVRSIQPRTGVGWLLVRRTTPSPKTSSPSADAAKLPLLNTANTLLVVRRRGGRWLSCGKSIYRRAINTSLPRPC